MKRGLGYEAARRVRLMWPREGRVGGVGGNRAYGGTRARSAYPIPPPDGPTLGDSSEKGSRVGESGIRPLGLRLKIRIHPKSRLTKIRIPAI